MGSDRAFHKDERYLRNQKIHCDDPDRNIAIKLANMIYSAW